VSKSIGGRLEEPAAALWASTTASMGIRERSRCTGRAVRVSSQRASGRGDVGILGDRQQARQGHNVTSVYVIAMATPTLSCRRASRVTFEVAVRSRIRHRLPISVSLDGPCMPRTHSRPAPNLENCGGPTTAYSAIWAKYMRALVLVEGSRWVVDHTLDTTFSCSTLRPKITATTTGHNVGMSESHALTGMQAAVPTDWT